jgi:hypothetical protein
VLRKPVKSLETKIKQDLLLAIKDQKEQKTEGLNEQIIKRSIKALGVDQKFVAELLRKHPELDIEAMPEDSIKRWMAEGLPDPDQMSKELLAAHLVHLLSTLVLELPEIKTLSSDLEFMATLSRLAPGVPLLSLNAITRAFVLYVTKMIGYEASDDDLISAVWNYPEISRQLAVVLEYDGISSLLQDPDNDWQEFFTATITLDT